MILREPRYVFDTNVLISALLFADSTPAKAFAYAQGHGKIYVPRRFSVKYRMYWEGPNLGLISLQSNAINF